MANDEQIPGLSPDEPGPLVGLPSAPPLNEPKLGSEVAVPSRPKSVEKSSVLWIVAALASIVTEALSFATHNRVLDEIVKHTQVTAEQAKNSAPNALSAIATVVLAVLWLGVVAAMRNAKNWARILLTVLGGVALVIQVLGGVYIQYIFAAGALGVLQGLVVIVSLLAIIGAIYFQFRAESNAYFRNASEG